MSTQTLSIEELANLLHLEAQRGIIDQDALLQMVSAGVLPKFINDIRGALRLSIERVEGGLEVTKHITALAEESVREIY
ncbi:hypothetical protein KKF04_00030 [Patescibacteria group bacterium]|nr:hypothetical protein [Patescibacteria group bacterium]MBU1934421.1 hypothetical protein [Patescibacteria group bacterium]